MKPNDFRGRLIEEVKKYRVLYDTTHEHHRDIDVRDRCWLEISERLGENSELLKREWKSLRDSLRQALKKDTSTSSDVTKAGLPAKKWRYQNRMAFVLPYMTKRNGPRRPAETVKISEQDIPSDQETELWDPTNTDSGALDMFFASVCQSAKRLPRKLQNQLKRQVLDALLRAEEECENLPGDTKTEFPMKDNMSFG